MHESESKHVKPTLFSETRCSLSAPKATPTATVLHRCHRKIHCQKFEEKINKTRTKPLENKIVRRHQWLVPFRHVGYSKHEGSSLKRKKHHSMRNIAQYWQLRILSWFMVLCKLKEKKREASVNYLVGIFRC